MSVSTSITILRLITQKRPHQTKPNRRSRLTPDQAHLLQVLCDEWLENGTPGGQLLAERLAGYITDTRCTELGFESWLGLCPLHRLVLFVMPERVLEEIAASGDEVLAFRSVAWLKRERPNSALHRLVAARVWRALRTVEAQEEQVRSEPGSVYPLDGLMVGFRKNVLLPGSALEGVAGLRDAEGFEIEIGTEGPLAALASYHPPAHRYVEWTPDEGEWNR